MILPLARIMWRAAGTGGPYKSLFSYRSRLERINRVGGSRNDMSGDMAQPCQPGLPVGTDGKSVGFLKRS